jgi:lambda family phage minor tail protein L
MTIPTVDIQRLDPGAVLDLFVLDCTPIGGTTYHFHAGTNGLGTSVVWAGSSYTPMPIEIEGMDQTSKGTLPRPTVRVANLDGTLSALLGTNEDLLGAKVIRKRTLAKYLDAANFSGGNANEDPTAAWPDEVFYIEQKSAETSEVIEWQLVSALDCQGLTLPRRLIQATVCTWADASICSYSVGGACLHTLAACKTHWGADATLPFGGFPASARIR